MNVLRALARPMLASFFLVSGFKALKNPEPLVPAAEPLAESVIPLVKRFAPDQIVDKIPDDTVTLVRINGALQLIGGIALATGKGRRLGALALAGSLIPTTLAQHRFWSEADPEQKAVDKAHFLKNVSLLGGVLIASADTEGRPSIAWRANTATQSLGKKKNSLSKKSKKAAKRLGDDSREAVDSALAEGVRMVESVMRESRKTKKRAAKKAKTARKDLKELAVSARDEARELAKNISLGEN